MRPEDLETYHKERASLRIEDRIPGGKCTDAEQGRRDNGADRQRSRVLAAYGQFLRLAGRL
jgi:hypothetical protein